MGAFAHEITEINGRPELLAIPNRQRGFRIVERTPVGVIRNLGGAPANHVAACGYRCAIDDAIAKPQGQLVPPTRIDSKHVGAISPLHALN